MGNNQDRIDSYLRDEFTQLESDDFKKSLNVDSHLKTDFELTKMISESLKERASLYKKMSVWENEYHQTNFNENRTKIVRRNIIRGIGLAACLILAFFVIKPYLNYDMTESENMYTYNVPHFNHEDFESSDYRSYTVKIDSLINQKEYEKAISLISLIEKDFEVIAANNGIIELEKAGIDKSHISNTERYLNDAYMLCWRKINVLIVLGNRQEALCILKDFKEQDGVYKEDAMKLYESLSKY